MLCCKCDFLGRLGFENRPFPRAQYFLEMFAICQTVKAKEFVELGFKGIEIKEKIHERRVELIEEYFKTVPNYELNDSNNEKPAQLKAKDQTYERKPQNKPRAQKGFFKVRFSNDIGEQDE